MKKIFTIYDNKAKAYLPPFFSQNTATAIREVEQAVNNPDHGLHVHAEDYGLFELGEFHESSGKIESEMPVHVLNLIELKITDIRIGEKT